MESSSFNLLGPVAIALVGGLAMTLLLTFWCIARLVAYVKLANSVRSRAHAEHLKSRSKTHGEAVMLLDFQLDARGFQIQLINFQLLVLYVLVAAAGIMASLSLMIYLDQERIALVGIADSIEQVSTMAPSTLQIIITSTVLLLLVVNMSVTLINKSVAIALRNVASESGQATA